MSQPLDWDTIRRRLMAGGPQFWRGLEELAETDAFREMMHREFPEQAATWTDPISRRRFLMLMGASLALAGLAGCGAQPPVGKIVPYVRQPEALVPGKPLYFATAMTLGGLATGLLVESHEGRPTKVEGNPKHPASLGATDAFAQASILGLYDPDRSQTITYLGRPRGWSEFLADSRLREALREQREQKGAGLRILTETITSPTLAYQIAGDHDSALLRQFPEARWYQYDAARSDHVQEGARLAFGAYVNTVYDFTAADVVVALDADFLSCGPAHLRYVHDFMSRRRVPLTPNPSPPAGGEGGKSSSPRPRFGGEEDKLSAPRPRFGGEGGKSSSPRPRFGGEEDKLSAPRPRFGGEGDKSSSPRPRFGGEGLGVRGETAMNRLYAVECTPSNTGAVADHRLRLRAGEVEAFTRALAAGLGVEGVQAEGDLPAEWQRWVRALVKDLQAHRGASIVIAGDAQPPVVHALVHAINHALGNVGKTVFYTDPVEARPVNQLQELRELVEDMAAGRVQLLLVLGANPVFTAPADLDFGAAMQRVPLRIHQGLYQDETAIRCHWHIPETHYLESWGDARAFDGTVSIIQPLIAPLYNAHSVYELLAALFGESETTGYEIVRGYWRRHWPKGGGDFERDWEQALHDGLIAGTALEPRKTLSLAPFRREPLHPSSSRAGASVSAGDGLEIVFQPDPTIYDGRFANNAWLQELPKPISKLTWDNAAFISPKTAEKYGLSVTFGARGGEHGQAIVDVVELSYRGRTLRAPVWILPGHADDSVTVTFGYGRGRSGTVGGSADNLVGFNAYSIRTSEAPWFDGGLRIRRTGERYTLACTQMHHRMEDRAPVRFGTLEEYRKDPHFAWKMGPSHDEEKIQTQAVPKPLGAEQQPPESPPGRQPLSLYPQYDYRPPINRWGMAIDLTACTGCSACVVACQAENNIPIVGKTEVTRGREMHWLRIDRYYVGDLDNPQTFFQPVPCMHCENAPCELVCPVAATAHSHDGLNDMVYNRCVGTRYCSNNCPYKVRRFNFLQYADYATQSLKLGRNPDVTVRSRGVMEKCTYCVQRIRAAQIEAEVEGRPLRDGDVLTACQAACPAGAIIFGDMNDANSRVAQMKKQPLDYGLLANLNTRPRTTYLAALRNPNPELQ